MLCLSYYLLGFLFDKIRKQGRTSSAWKWSGEAQTMYTHVKNDKMEGESKKINKIKFLNNVLKNSSVLSKIQSLLQ
jgi:hypothetical protein